MVLEFEVLIAEFRGTQHTLSLGPCPSWESPCLVDLVFVFFYYFFRVLSYVVYFRQISDSSGPVDVLSLHHQIRTPRTCLFWDKYFPLVLERLSHWQFEVASDARPMQCCQYLRLCCTFAWDHKVNGPTFSLLKLLSYQSSPSSSTSRHYSLVDAEVCENLSDMHNPTYRGVSQNWFSSYGKGNSVFGASSFVNLEMV